VDLKYFLEVILRNSTHVVSNYSWWSSLATLLAAQQIKMTGVAKIQQQEKSRSAQFLE
jgi:hypothetical protein